MDAARVLLDTTATAEEIEAVQGALKAAGFDGPVEASVPPQGDEMWLVLLAVPVSQFLQGFLGEAGKDAWRRLKDFVDRLAAAHRGGPTRPGQLLVRPNVLTRDDINSEQRSVVFPGWSIAGDRSTEVTLSPDMPEEAYRELFDLDLADYQGMTLFWDSIERTWRSTPKSVRKAKS